MENQQDLLAVRRSYYYSCIIMGINIDHKTSILGIIYLSYKILIRVERRSFLIEGFYYYLCKVVSFSLYKEKGDHIDQHLNHLSFLLLLATSYVSKSYMVLDCWMERDNGVT